MAVEIPPFAAQVLECTQRLARDGIAVLGALYDLTGTRLVRYATTLTRNQHDAEDAVQSALAKFSLRPTLLAGASTPWAYLLRSVRNEALQINRHTKRVQGDLRLIDLRTRRRVDELEQEETHHAVWQALRRLPVEQAEVVVLKVWEQMTFEAIAELLEISPNTVASRYQYAIQKLSQSLAPTEREARP